MKRKIITIITLLCIMVSCFNINVKAEENEKENTGVENNVNEQKYRLGTVKKTDSNYKNSKKIDSSDVHYGWDLGNFYIKGYTAVDSSDKDCPVFLKTVGDDVKLYFDLEQDINKLNGSSRKHISDDGDGIDEYFGLKKQKFHHGALIIKKINYQNEEEEPVVYTDYLKGIKKGAETEVDIFEEGDYEVALDYQITHEDHKLLGKYATFDNDYYNYRIFFKFKIRNGNCMVFPFDVATKQELSNCAVTENGFYLDLAKSRYLNINVERRVLNEAGDELVEDVRFNKPAKDGDEYTEEGIYIIKVKNDETDQETEKMIYVGTDDVLKAYATTGLSISEIKEKINEGAVIDEQGNVTFDENVESKALNTKIKNISTSSKKSEEDSKGSGVIIVIFILLVIIFLGAGCFIFIKKKKEIK